MMLYAGHVTYLPMDSSGGVSFFFFLFFFLSFYSADTRFDLSIAIYGGIENELYIELERMSGIETNCI